MNTYPSKSDIVEDVSNTLGILCVIFTIFFIFYIRLGTFIAFISMLVLYFTSLLLKSILLKEPRIHLEVPTADQQH